MSVGTQLAGDAILGFREPTQIEIEGPDGSGSPHRVRVAGEDRRDLEFASLLGDHREEVGVEGPVEHGRRGDDGCVRVFRDGLVEPAELDQQHAERPVRRTRAGKTKDDGKERTMTRWRKLLTPAVWVFYVAIVLEILFMISPFALYFYSSGSLKNE